MLIFNYIYTFSANIYKSFQQTTILFHNSPPLSNNSTYYSWFTCFWSAIDLCITMVTECSENNLDDSPWL